MIGDYFQTFINEAHAHTERFLSDYSDGNAQQRWVNASVPDKAATGNSYFALSGGQRINSGIGTGDEKQRDSMGNITGYTPRSRASLTPGLDRLNQMKTASASVGPDGKRVPLSTASGTPGLDALHLANPNMTHSWDKPTPPLVVKKTSPSSDVPHMVGYVNEVFD